LRSSSAPNGAPPFQYSSNLLALGAPCGFVRARQRVQVGGSRGRVIHQRRSSSLAVDHVDGEAPLLVLVREIPPQRIVGSQTPQRLEREREQPPRPKRLVVVVSGVLDVNLESRAQLAGVLVEGGLEPTGA